MPKTTPTSASCNYCPPTKPGSWCAGCPRNQGFHFTDARIRNPAGIVVITDVLYKSERAVDLQLQHLVYNDDTGKTVAQAIKTVQSESQAYANIPVAKTYAVLCSGDKPKSPELNSCANFLRNSLATATGDQDRTPILVAMGTEAVKALGISVTKISDIQSRVMPGVEIGGKTYTVIPTMSAKQLIAVPGLYRTFMRDLQKAFELRAAGPAPDPKSIEVLTKDYRFPSTVAEVSKLVDDVIAYTEGGKDPNTWSIAVDTETNTLFPHRAGTKILGVSVAWATGKSAFIPLWHKETPYNPEDVFEHVLRLLACKKPKITHNGKYDSKVFRRFKLAMENWAWDSMLGEHALEEDKKGQYGLKSLTRVFFPEFASYADTLHEMKVKEEGDSQLASLRKVAKTKAATGTKKSKKKEDGGFENIPLKTLALYAAVDTDMTRRLTLLQLKRITDEQTTQTRIKALAVRDRTRPQTAVYTNPDPQPTRTIVKKIAVPVSECLSEVEYIGVPVDRAYGERLRNELDTVVGNARNELHRMAGKTTAELNLNSTKHIANVLFSSGYCRNPEDPTSHVRFEPVTFTKKGAVQTTEKVLKHLVLKNKCDFSAKLLIYRKAIKARDTFLKNVLELSEYDGRLHTNYNVHGTATGRLSSNDENMQNIPKELAGHSIKKIFTTSGPDMVFVNVDAKGAEVKIFAAYSGDAELIRSLNAGMDTHCFIANKIIDTVKQSPTWVADLGAMGLPPQYAYTYDDFNNRKKIKKSDELYYEILDKFRTAIKRVVFGILYGAGPGKIAETIGISLDQAKLIIAYLFKLFPSIPRYIEHTKWELATYGMVETFFGRRRRFAIKNATGYLRKRAERQAVNFKIQSTSSDIVMQCLLHIAPIIKRLGGQVLLTVHDSIGFEIPKALVTALPQLVKKHLTDYARQIAPWLPVDFSWDCEVGPSYGELKDYKEYIEKLTDNKGRDIYAEAYTEEEIKLALDAAALEE